MTVSDGFGPKHRKAAHCSRTKPQRLTQNQTARLQKCRSLQSLEEEEEEELRSVQHEPVSKQSLELLARCAPCDDSQQVGPWSAARCMTQSTQIFGGTPSGKHPRQSANICDVPAAASGLALKRKARRIRSRSAEERGAWQLASSMIYFS